MTTVFIEIASTELCKIFPWGQVPPLAGVRHYRSPSSGMGIPGIYPLNSLIAKGKGVNVSL